MNLVFHSKEKLNEYLSKVKLRIRECGYISLATAKMLAEYPSIRCNDHHKVYWSVESFIVGKPKPWLPYYTVCLDEKKSGTLYDRSLAIGKSIIDGYNDGLDAATYAIDEFYKIKANGETNMGPKDETTSVNYFHDGKPIGSIISVDMESHANGNGVGIKAAFNDTSVSCTIQDYIKNDIKTTEETYMDYIKATLNARWGLPLGTIEKVIFNYPATIVIWNDGTKTVVKCENEPFDPEKGLAMAISKKFFGNRGNYFDIFKKWVPREKPEDKCALGKIIETENINRFYIELPDGYRLIFEDSEYAGRYNPESESDVTAPVTDNTNAPFIAGKRHKIVCASDCYHVKNIKPENRLYFNSFEEAIANGCRPCKHCNGMHKEINKVIQYGTLLPKI